MQNKSTGNRKSKDKLSKSTASAGTIRITLTISKSLLKRVDEAARQDYTNRSDLIRQSLLWYLRPQGRDLDQANPEVIIKALQQRKAKAELNKIAKDLNLEE